MSDDLVLDLVRNASSRVARHLEGLPITVGPTDRLVLMLLAEAHPLEPLVHPVWLMPRLGLALVDVRFVVERLERLVELGLLRRVLFSDISGWQLSRKALGIPESSPS